MKLNPIYAQMGITIFEKMSALCRDGSRINLGQGFPDDSGPPELIEAAARALRDRSNQYPPSPGVPELRDAVAEFYRHRQGLDLNRDNILVTSGATEGIAVSILATVNPGDEVLIFNPAFDVYAPMVRRAGGVPVFIDLLPPQWTYDRACIEAAITPRTRVMLLNDPLNPTGTCASETELAMLADICIAHDLIAICDDVWEAVRFDGRPHRSLFSLPGMAQRSVKIGSAGKIFGLTGWKIGWLCAQPPIALALARAHQFLTFTTPPALQYAVAEGLAMDGVIDARNEGWKPGRTLLSACLHDAGFAVLDNSATWFTCIDLPASGITLADEDFAEGLVNHGGVATIPVSALCEGGGVKTVLRLCHAKPESSLREAVQRMAAFRASL